MAYEGKDQYSPLILLCRLQDLLNWVEEASRGPLTESERAHTARMAEEFRVVYGERRYIPTDSATGEPK